MKKLIAAFSLLVMLTGCSSEPPEKTQDPDEIEELRQKHQSMAEREKADG